MIMTRTKLVLLAFVSLALAGGFSGCGGDGDSTPPPTSSPSPPPTQPSGPTPNVTTYHNDLGRTGQYLSETTLNRTNVNPTTFGKIGSMAVDGLIYAQPLYIQNVSVPSVGSTNLVVVETEHDSVYAFNADTLSTTPVWSRSFLGDTTLACSNCSTVTSTAVNAPNIYPEIGITATPVIDPVSMTIYILALTDENGTFYHKLHALDLTTGKERSGSPVVISGKASGGGFGSSNGEIAFNANWQLSRAGLALYNGNLIFAFSSFDDQEPTHGWIFSYNASTLRQNSAMITSPNSGVASVWGGAPAIDSSGNIYVATGNDDGNNVTLLDYGNSIVKLNQGLQITDWFQPYNSVALSEADIDVGSGGVLLVPEQPGPNPNLVISGGKQGTIYVANQGDLGHMNTAAGATSDTNILQAVTNLLPSGKSCCAGIYGTPSYYENKVFVAAAGDFLRSFPIVNGQLDLATMTAAKEPIAIRGATGSISSNGGASTGSTENGIIWILNASAYQYSSSGKPVTNGPAVLMSYSTDDLSTPLYRSDRVPADAAGFPAKYALPTVANGKVFVGGQGNGAFYAGQTAVGTLGNGQLTVYGVIPARTLPVENPNTPPPAKLSETGFFTDLGSMTPSSGVLPYDVNSPLWSDGSGKGRWLVLPAGQKMTFNTTQPWTFPVGTQMIKLFALDLGNGVTTRVETRVLTLGTAGWTGVTYQWLPVGAAEADQTDAQLLSASANQTYTLTASGGATSSQVWYFPSPTDCLSCHTASNGGALGVNTRQLNRLADPAGTTTSFPTIPTGDVSTWIGSSWTAAWVPNPSNAGTTACSSTAAASGSQNQLALWNNMGLFTTNIGDPSQCDAYALDSDPTATPEKRFRSYTAVNCAICHSPNGTAGVNIDFSYDTALASVGIVNVVPAKGNVGVSGALLVTPGDAADSVVPLRMDTTNTSFRMPPLATNVIDQTAVAVTGYWIDNLATSTGSSVIQLSTPMRSKFNDWNAVLSH
jgi:mono/diheme cytochrome c family protein